MENNNLTLIILNYNKEEAELIHNVPNDLDFEEYVNTLGYNEDDIAWLVVSNIKAGNYKKIKSPYIKPEAYESKN